MPILRSLRSLLVASTIVGAVSSGVQAQVQYATVALSGMAAPDMPAGVRYAHFIPPGVNDAGQPAINDTGQVAYFASLTGIGITSANEQAIYAGGATAPRLVARQGDPAPGAPAGATYSFLTSPAINDHAQISYHAFLSGSGVTASNNQAIYARGFADPQLVAREGDAAPGVQAGITYGHSFMPGASALVGPDLNNAGQLTFRASLTGSGVSAANDEAIYAGGFAVPQLVAREGEPAPDTPAGVSYLSLGTPAINDAGQVAYSTALRGGGVTFQNNGAIYAGDLASPQLVARTGDAAPGTPAGVNYRSLSPPLLNDAGEIAYYSLLTGVSPGQDAAIYAGEFAAPQLVAREGYPAPGTPAGVKYLSLFWPAISDSGGVTFGATLTGTGVTSENDQALYAGEFSAPQLVARRGDSAPGAAAGLTYFNFLGSAINDAGQVAYLASLTGNGLGLFAFDPTLGCLLIAREGDLFDVGGGDFRTIAEINFQVGQSEDLRTGLSNSGMLAFNLVFADGTSGVFTAAIAVPESPGLLIIAPVAILARRHGPWRVSHPKAGRKL